jgi:hypothetical protein
VQQLHEIEQLWIWFGAGLFSLSSTCTIEMTLSKGEALKLVRVVAPHFRDGL